ncbi:tetratricopeptide repeat protein [Sphingomonas sp. CL5.1]|uniref:tetratricopeptide repeat-containing sulfotransferase family protein n=1 Tax=Sphingomonas sp. CL5.1 TaxID=2653203 RepID=UPI0015833A39|nr:tetratricopeptide repeat-containing sulfotransferase family protein [Sphingomonas sp. CL5.1]QKS01741.1 tetratricopeptide repeat protein [Sphingomonas sp. CL5.1]
MTDLEAALTAAFEDLQRGDPAAAEGKVARWVAAGSIDPRLAALRGQSLLALGRAPEAIPQLERALDAAPGHPALLTKLAFALIEAGRLDDARRAASHSPAAQLRRIVAYVDQQQGRHNAAIVGFRAVLAEMPDDYESWNNLGLLTRDAGALGEAIEAFSRAVALRPRDSLFHIGLSQALAAAARHGERQQVMRRAATLLPGDISILTELGLAEGGVDDFDAAERAYRSALRIDPHHTPAWRELGMLLDRMSRLEALEELIADARRRGLSDAAIAFVEATLMRRRGKPVEALEALAGAGDDINPARFAELRGQLNDALGNFDEAFAAFTEMNRIGAAEPAALVAQAMNFPGEITATIARLRNEPAVRSPSVSPIPTTTSPVFIIGFPRSGTTLLDTMLRNLSELMVLEEPPMLEAVERSFGSIDPAALSEERIANGRATYFDHLTRHAGEEIAERTVVDKYPLHMVRVPLIHRLFPAAKFVFVERHPCDSLLSCFMARFVPNKAMVHFQHIESAARLFDLSFNAWSLAEERLPLNVHRIRYEQMVTNPEAEMRSLLDFLEIAWNPAVLDNRAGAAANRVVATASYAQVTQPINDRSIGRWRNYQKYLEPALPTLARWAERMHYAL